MEKPKIVQIRWIDVQAIDIGLQTVEELKEIKPLIANLVGYLVLDDKENYYVAKEYWEDCDMFKYVHIVPKKTAILNIIELEGKK